MRIYAKKVSSGYGIIYQRVVITEILTTDEFAQHIAGHGSPYTRDVINGVLMAACDCLVELCMDSKAVLGTTCSAKINSVLSDKVHGLPLFKFGILRLTFGMNLLQVERHVLCQSAHGLHAL